ncbi:RTA1 like protein-domain-containing protein [Xylariales sp. PMI_506]|nr:RTA1 like protein-domain-containing protein [Xylariales sp. PMI_506]
MFATPRAVSQDHNNCLALIPGHTPVYGYQPSLAAGIVFCVLFFIALAGHTVQIARFRRWTSVLLALGALTEIIGWAGRTWSAKCPYNQNAFLMQITTLIIAPTFFTAALYVLLGQLIIILGRESSMLSPRMYAIVFCACDIVSLVVQAIGGGMASVASNSVNGNTKPGTDIMVAGIVFQMFTMTVFLALALDFLRRSARLSIPPQYYRVLAVASICLLAVYIRSIYRTIELAQGWTGYLITHQSYFIGLDGALMVLAVGIMLVFDPASIISRNPANVEK